MSWGIQLSTSNIDLYTQDYFGHALGFFLVSQQINKPLQIGFGGQVFWLNYSSSTDARQNEWQGTFYSVLATTFNVNNRGGVYLELNPLGFHKEIAKNSTQSVNGPLSGSSPQYFFDSGGLYIGAKVGYAFKTGKKQDRCFRVFVSSNILRYLNIGVMYVL